MAQAEWADVLFPQEVECKIIFVAAGRKTEASSMQAFPSA